MSLSHAPATIRQEIIHLMASAPPTAQAAICSLFLAAKTMLDSGYHPDVRGVPLKAWPCLLGLLADVATMHHDVETLLRVTNDLLSIADKMAPPSEVLQQSAEILIHALHGDMYACRLRNPRGEWHIHSCATANGGAVPLFAPFIEEGTKAHPVMELILAGGARHVVSNDLHGLERGGQSLDCMAYMSGYRSRLAFVLRERNDRAPFGLVMLYSKHEYGFDMYDARFLAKCARIVTLTVGRRVAVARDTLEKAAGAMAHYGNNAMNILRNQAEYCSELVEDMDDDLHRALRLSRELAAEFPEGTRQRRLAEEIEVALSKIGLTELAGNLGGVLEGSRRMTRIIGALKKSAERPRLMHYALGRRVLNLDE
ncbi:MAG: hypothetical protein RRY29_08165 [Desulfovibrionaceae bacterium]